MTDTTTAPLSARHLTLAHGEHTIIHELDTALPAGQVTAIVGPNGCGKSTLLNGLARIHKPRGGAVLLNGADIHALPAREVARRLALLPQETHAPEGLTVADLVRFGRHPHQRWLQQWSEADQRALEQALAAADVADLADRPLDTLSGGQRQRAWIAMSIAQETPLLLLDEPTSALDLGHQIEVFELIRSLAGQGKTIAMVVHDLASACRYADHLIAMREGRILRAGAPAEVVTTELIEALYGVTCDLMHDPASGSPVLINLRRVAR
ncbi:ABC transporter ATP-binding protein [Marinobacter lutaoensis]|jgi:iron complex transport system ATP-binding protein|uniref:ABC transporter n=2 Tax=Marinobacter TaxID=2742 RepID=A0A1V2DWI0_9GAMM|nr:ABC transporter ATP-binding protein [Marinobacter sp.]MBI41939.1 ABC transporter ATP-binding protein [Oceanospirillales bacterium]NVD36525.1 ABC transporter ATP-binding protein [Marinobacter lutaoensis]ONF44897.1 ABC transporter [Marinobacter lutaoensis]